MITIAICLNEELTSKTCFFLVVKNVVQNVYGTNMYMVQNVF